MTDEFDPFLPEVQRDPYPHYARLRRERPVAHVAARKMWAVSRHADVGAALKRADLFSSAVMGPPDLPASESLLSADPPAHSALRKRVERSFTPARVRDLRPRVGALAESLATALRTEGSFDVVARLAAPLPLIVIAELMGIDPERHDDFKIWADAIITRGTGRPSPEDRKVLDARVAALKAYLREIIERRRTSPGDDLVSALLRADADDGLSPAQALNFSVLLLLGGSETTTNLIGNSLRALFADEALMARARRDPTVIAATVEETLRFDPPVQSVLRITTREVEIADARIPSKSVVLLLLGSANRDERVFADADRFWVERQEPKHLAFGAGPHYCLGATLARMEATAALEALLALPNLRPLQREVSLVDSFQLRGPRELRVTCDP
jgi:cytochrome P450